MKLILVVDDDEDTGLTIVDAISQETPYQVIYARDGIEAINLTQRLKPDLFLIDCSLPGMNGIDLYDHLHAAKELEDIPAIIFSASIEKHLEAIQQRQLYGLSKPFELDELLAAIESKLHVPSPISTEIETGIVC